MHRNKVKRSVICIDDVAHQICVSGGVAIASDVLLDSRDNCRSLVEMTLEKFDRLSLAGDCCGCCVLRQEKDKQAKQRC